MSDSDIVYHGTNLFAANLILSWGIRLDTQRRFSDFGKGFYVTFNQKQAERWARVKATNLQVSPKLLAKLNVTESQYLNHQETKIPAVIAANLDMKKLATLKGRIFPFPGHPLWLREKPLWETFVYVCRSGIVEHPYDFVYGPVAGGHFKYMDQLVVSKSKDQLSLNSNAAIHCLSNPRIFIPHKSERIEKDSGKYAQILQEVSECLNEIFGRSLMGERELNELLKSLDPSILLNESPYYWAFFAKYGSTKLWEEEYERFMERKAKSVFFS
ncbi:DUF3990 domain-containing protein [Bacillus sp. ISL-37]|uniref:DUF3990 domain-containing protein n=1 Tax=Bacillus sp. ISL-37 TaxID=2819123 RepID=UPI001BE91104|nr:DUF3990 domain-containing protein [Bacillus sp. ISL-37]MBT2682757.1 DUF3990 domain-containing protein [Bacillus sp. ISL-37]